MKTIIRIIIANTISGPIYIILALLGFALDRLAEVFAQAYNRIHPTPWKSWLLG